jgi:glucose-1-phosphate adenylyltransferase
MDIRQMVEVHVQRNADISVAAVPFPLEQASSFGVITAQRDGRILDFQEKPERPVPIPERPSHAYASMGNYLFNPSVLAPLLEQAAVRGETDFGRHVLPQASATHRVFAYDFAGNRVPGVLPHEAPNYWRDVGTLEAYREALADVAGSRPTFNLTNERWPIASNQRSPINKRVAVAH